MKKVLSILLLLTFLTFWSHAQTLVPYNCGDKWGYADETGKLVLPCRYDAISRFVNGKALVRKKDKDMLIDAKGKVLFEEGNDYEEIVRGDENYLIARTVGEREPVFIHVKTLKTYPAPQLKGMFIFHAANGRVWCVRPNQEKTDQGPKIVSPDTWIPQEGVDLIAWDIEKQQVLVEARLKVLPPKGNREATLWRHLLSHDWWILEKEGKKGIWSSTDIEEVIPIEYDEIQFTLFTQPDAKYFDSFAVLRKNGKYGIYAIKEKKEIYPCLYDRLFVLESKYFPNHFVFTNTQTQESRLVYVSPDNQVHVGNATFNTLKENDAILPKLNYYDVVSYVLVRAGYKGKVGCIDLKGNWVVPPMFEDINVRRLVFKKPLLLPVKKEGKWGLFSVAQQRLLISPTYSYMSPFAEGYGVGYKKGTRKNPAAGVVIDSVGHELKTLSDTLMAVPMSADLFWVSTNRPKSQGERWFLMDWRKGKIRDEVIKRAYHVDDFSRYLHQDILSDQFDMLNMSVFKEGAKYSEEAVISTKDGSIVFPDIDESVRVLTPPFAKLSSSMDYSINLQTKEVVNVRQKINHWISNILNHRLYVIESYEKGVNIYDLKTDTYCFDPEDAKKYTEIHPVQGGLIKAIIDDKGKYRYDLYMFTEAHGVKKLGGFLSHMSGYELTDNLYYKGAKVVIDNEQNRLIGCTGEVLLAIDRKAAHINWLDIESSLKGRRINWGEDEAGIILDSQPMNYTAHAFNSFYRTPEHRVWGYHLINTRTGKVVYSSEYPIYPTHNEKIYRVTYKDKDGRRHAGYIHLNGTRYWKE